jgi:hypothetical protein
MRLIILKRKKLTYRLKKTWERRGTVGPLTLDRHIGVLGFSAHPGSPVDSPGRLEGA